MNTKQIISTISFLAMTVLIALGSVWQPAAAKSQIVHLVAGQTIGLGEQGLHVSNIPTGVSQVYVDNIGTNLPSRFTYKMPFHYRAPAMEVRFLSAKGIQIEQIEAQVYVYFNINKAERSVWLKSGMEEIAIWFASEESGAWEMCPTRFVEQVPDKGTIGRLTCLAQGSGYYVLSQGDFSQYLLDPQSTGSKKTEPAHTLKIRAYIDGRSQIIIVGNTLHWHHLDFAAPGRHYFFNEPTFLNNVKWQPTWPDKPDAENRDCGCDSSTYEGIPNLAHSGQTVTLYMVQGRGKVSILQQPAAGNDYTLIVDLDDNPLDGPAWYEINLNYATVTSR